MLLFVLGVLVVRSTTVKQLAAAPSCIIRHSKFSKPLAVVVLLDVSPSMNGDKLSNAIAGLINVVSSLRDTDVVCVVTFADTVEMHILFEAKPQALAKLAQLAANLRTRGRQTALFDAIEETMAMARTSIQEMFVKHAPLIQLVVLTDGQDTCSQHASASSCQQLLAHPGVGFSHFHCILISVGVRPSVEALLRQMVDNAHSQLIPINSVEPGRAILDAFRVVIERIQVFHGQAPTVVKKVHTTYKTQGVRTNLQVQQPTLVSRSIF